MARRTKAEIAAIKQGLYNILAASNPQTVHGVFYKAVSAGLIEKTEAQYRGTVCRLLKELRLDGTMPFRWLVDNTRWMRKPASHSDLLTMLENAHRLYRRAIWNDQADYVEIWCEKDAIAGLLYEVTSEWDVPLMVTRGFSSLSFLHNAAEIIMDRDKPTYIYYFGDHDPSGLTIDKAIQKRLLEFAPGSEIHFERQAVIPWQIEDWDLPTRPTKKTDSRSKAFKGDSVEVDAIPEDILKEIVQICIKLHIDKETYHQTIMAEQAEKETLAGMIVN